MLQFGGLLTSPRSSLTILAKSLLVNRTYQFQVFMENRRNASLQATGFLLVRVDDTYPQLVIIGFVTLFP